MELESFIKESLVQISNGIQQAKVKIAVVEAGIGGKIKTSEQAISRIQFSVNVNQWYG